MSVFKNVDPSKLFTNGSYIEDGDYWIRITKTAIGKNRKNEAHSVIEGVVVRAMGDCKNKVGETVAKITKTTSDYFFQDACDFVAAMLGFEAKNETKEALEEALVTVFEPKDGVSIFLNQVVHVSAKTIITKKEKPFTRIKWHGAVPAKKVLETLSPEDIARFWPNGELQQLAAVEQ